LQFKKIISKVTSALIFLIFAAGLFVFITVLVSWKSGVPNFLGYSFMSVSTPSMVPTYPVGTVVITKKVDINKLKVGDVISFYSDDPAIFGIPNTHRIVTIGINEVNRKFFITKGDNNPVADTYPVYGDKVIGKVEGSIGSVGKIISKVKNRYVMFFLLVVPLAVIMAFELKNITKLIKRGDDDTKPDTVPEHKD